MRIVTPAEIERVAWEGYLQPTGEAFKAPLGARVTLGEPAWWSAEQAMERETGKRWVPPAESHHYTLVRLACTLHPLADSRARYIEAVLTAYLRPRRAQAGGSVVAHDLFPQRLTTENRSTFSVSLGPDLKFAHAIEVSLLEVGAEIEYRRAFPVLQGFGLGGSHPYWQFAHHASEPLLGCQSVYVVVDAPQNAGGVRLSIELVATVATHFGPVRVGLPQEAHAHVSSTVGA